VLIEMNAICFVISGWVQRASSKVCAMIDGIGHSADTLRSPRREERTMFKTISAALIAVSLAAAPAFATTRMGEHHDKHARHHLHHKHKKVVAKRTHAKVGFRHPAPTITKRG